MGMFDSIYVSCPTCDEQIEFQSKAGPCDLKRYHYKNVPAAIAMSISGETEICKYCNDKVTLICDDVRIAMIIKDEELPNWD